MKLALSIHTSHIAIDVLMFPVLLFSAFDSFNLSYLLERPICIFQNEGQFSKSCLITLSEVALFNFHFCGKS